MKNLSRGTLIISFISSVFCCGLSAYAQPTGDNKVKSYKAQKVSGDDLSTVNDKDKVSEGTAYYDDLGREVQTVSRQQSPAGNDVVTFTTYDRYGRKTISFLPFVSTEANGNKKSNPQTAQQSFYSSRFPTADAASAYSSNVIENSDVGRVMERTAPGDSWDAGSGHTITHQYLMNQAEEVLMFNYNPTTKEVTITPGEAMYFQPNRLNCVKTADEHQNEMLVFTDREGKTVCKTLRAPLGERASTYYIYDPSNNLVAVIPPEGVKSILDLLNP